MWYEVGGTNKERPVGEMKSFMKCVKKNENFGVMDRA